MKKEFLPFQKARSIVRKISINSINDWKKKYYIYKLQNYNIPLYPDARYKNKGWKNWMDWLNTKNIQGSHRKYKVNDDFFNKWSSNMAYVLGMWWTDGNIYGNIFSISQHKNKRYILNKILKVMDSNYKIIKVNSSKCCYFQIRSHKIVKDLKHLGGEENKSSKCIFPKIPKKYLPDFIRGCWDGDGCISYNKNAKGYISVLSSGSKEFIDNTIKYLRNNIKDIKGTISVIKPRIKFFIKGRLCRNNAVQYQIRFGINDTKRLRPFMYYKKDLLCLIDKRKKFEKCVDIRLHNKDKIFLPYKKCQKIALKTGIKSLRQWYAMFSSKKLPHGLPSHPQIIYKNNGWINWYNFLGTKQH